MTAEDSRDLAGADLHAALNDHVLATFLHRPEAGPALTAAAAGDELRLMVAASGAWVAIQAGAAVAAGQLDVDAQREIAEAGMNAITNALNAEPVADKERISAAVELGAELVVGLSITRSCDTVSMLLRSPPDHARIFSAQRVIEHPAEHRLTPHLH